MDCQIAEDAYEKLGGDSNSAQQPLDSDDQSIGDAIQKQATEPEDSSPNTSFIKIPDEATPNQLAQLLAERHRTAAPLFCGTAIRAIEIAAILQRIKSQIRHGAYTSWLRENISEKHGISLRTLSRYQRLARRLRSGLKIQTNEDECPNKKVATTISKLSVSELEALSAGDGSNDKRSDGFATIPVLEKTALNLFGSELGVHEVGGEEQLDKVPFDGDQPILLNLTTSKAANAFVKAANDFRGPDTLVVVPIRFSACWHPVFKKYSRCITGPVVTIAVLSPEKRDEFHRHFAEIGSVFVPFLRDFSFNSLPNRD